MDAQDESQGYARKHVDVQDERSSCSDARSPQTPAALASSYDAHRQDERAGLAKLNFNGPPFGLKYWGAAVVKKGFVGGSSFPCPEPRFLHPNQDELSLDANQP